MTGVQTCALPIFIVEKIRNAPELGYQVVGFVDDDPPDETEYDGPPYLGPLAAIPGLIQEHTVSELIIALPSLSHQQLLEIVGSCGRARVNIKVLPDLFQIMASEVSTSELGGLPMLRIRDVTLRGWNLVLKRAMDIVVSATALVLLSPLMLLLALLVKLTSEGPVFYTQERVGLDGRPFQLIKFRSMRVDAEAEIGPVWAKPNDERTTRIGAFMRRYSLDELPQLINVAKGEMSFIGPRPPLPSEIVLYKPWQYRRLSMKPGISGLWQVSGRSDLTFDEMVLLDIYYIENWSPALDLRILLRTIPTVLLGSGAY